MAHAVFRLDRDVIPGSDDFAGGKVDRITLDDFLGEVLHCVDNGPGGHCSKRAADMMEREDSMTCPGEESHLLSGKLGRKIWRSQMAKFVIPNSVDWWI